VCIDKRDVTVDALGSTVKYCMSIDFSPVAYDSNYNIGTWSTCEFKVVLRSGGKRRGESKGERERECVCVYVRHAPTVQLGIRNGVRLEATGTQMKRE